MQRDPNAAKKPTDPLMYSSLLDSWTVERNPLQAVAGDIGRMMNVIVNLGKTRKLAQARMAQLQNQVRKIETQIAETNPKHLGSRLDKLR